MVLVGTVLIVLFDCWRFSYIYNEQDHLNKVFNELKFIFYLIFGTMQILYLVGFGCILFYWVVFQSYAWETYITILGTLRIVFFILLFVKKFCLAFSISKVLYVVKDKKDVKRGVITIKIFSFIPIIRYFSNIIFYCYVVKQLKRTDFEFRRFYNWEKDWEKRVGE